MKDSNFALVSALVLLLLVFWLGFLFHRSPEFAGSLPGGMLAVTGSVMMTLIPLAYLLVKRVKSLNRWATRYISLRTLLTWHLYTGVFGAILVILHTGHKFDSPLGIALIAVTLLAVFSGYAGHFLMRQCSQTILEKRKQLTQLEIAYRQAAGELAASPEQVSLIEPFSKMITLWIGSMLPWNERDSIASPGKLIKLTGAMADVENSLKMHVTFKSALGWCLKLHLALAFTLYLLLALHIWSGIHFGLRWFA